MGRYLGRVRPWLTPVLLLVIAALGLILARKAGVLSFAWLKSNKDALDAVGSVVTLTAVAAGGVLGYYRFFRGRTWTSRADLSLEVNVVDGAPDRLLHSIGLTVANRGTVPIWDPLPIVRVTARFTDGAVAESVVNSWYEPPEFASMKRGSAQVIDSEETAAFFAEHLVDAKAWAVSYAATLTCRSGDVWTVVRTVKNAPPT